MDFSSPKSLSKHSLSEFTNQINLDNEGYFFFFLVTRNHSLIVENDESTEKNRDTKDD